MAITHAPRIASGSITQFQAVQNSANFVVGATTNLSSIKFVGLSLSTATNNTTAYIIENGTVDSSVFNLGDGYVCAVGVNASGIPIRITDASCVSGLNYLGYCNAHGTITVMPRIAENLNAKDFGAKGDGVTDDTAAIMLLVRAAKAQSPINGQFAGIELYFPHGTYLCSQQINFDANADDITHDWPNTTLRGDTSTILSNSNFGSSTLLYTGVGSTSFISALSSGSFCLRDLGIVYNNNGFTGTLVDLGISIGLGAESTYARIESCIIGCYNSLYQTASEAVRLGSTI